MKVETEKTGKRNWLTSQHSFLFWKTGWLITKESSRWSKGQDSHVWGRNVFYHNSRDGGIWWLDLSVSLACCFGLNKTFMVLTATKPVLSYCVLFAVTMPAQCQPHIKGWHFFGFLHCQTILIPQLNYLRSLQSSSFPPIWKECSFLWSFVSLMPVTSCNGTNVDSAGLNKHKGRIWHMIPAP